MNGPIIGVAVKYGDLTICLPKPNRHHDVIKYAVEALGLTPPVHGTRKGGFYLANGTFLNRKQALQYVNYTNHPTVREPRNELNSEDLW